ncbi:unnamed protein product [Paramecium primaurelia]|uniref:Uncharacterized protein n=1 Tax=Paramecium primaurelia TaxID=5886 RepID=A0A8S1PLM6_PARPR|nr:unnamed protein product [Paramecium primaurelia]CAD8104109.1 unnamed protein product [Paramecium primaurelia]
MKQNYLDMRKLRIISIIYGINLGKAHQSLHKLLIGIEISSFSFNENNINVVILLVQHIRKGRKESVYEQFQILQKKDVIKKNERSCQIIKTLSKTSWK